MKPVLSSPFSPAAHYGLGHRLVLHEDRVELRRFGMLRRSIPLSSITHVFVAADSHQDENFRLSMQDTSTLEGHLEALTLWKYALAERLGAILEAPPMPNYNDSALPQAA